MFHNGTGQQSNFTAFFLHRSALHPRHRVVNIYARGWTWRMIRGVRLWTRNDFRYRQIGGK